MTEPYSAPDRDFENELIIKKSRFIGLIFRVENREEAEIILKKMKRLHPKANHHCYGFISGHPKSTQNFGFSDDGEPTGTAGKPILNVLQGSGLGKILVVVIRYFGGIKLGTGGLVSAYSDAAKEVLKIATTELVESKSKYKLIVPYSMEPWIRNILNQSSIPANINYSNHVDIEFELSKPQADYMIEILG